MKYKITLDGHTYEVEVENDKAMVIDEYEAYAPVAPAAAPAPATAPAAAPAAGWNCTACGAVNQGRFCSNCGAAKPAGVPQYKCDKCGWMPEDPTKAPKFCPNCGDPFGDEDRI